MIYLVWYQVSSWLNDVRITFDGMRTVCHIVSVEEEIWMTKPVNCPSGLLLYNRLPNDQWLAPLPPYIQSKCMYRSRWPLAKDIGHIVTRNDHHLLLSAYSRLMISDDWTCKLTSLGVSLLLETTYFISKQNIMHQ